MSDSARHNLFLLLESTYGVTPAADPEFTDVRHTGTTLGLGKEGFTSDELHADRQIRDFRHGVKTVGGDINFELSYGSFDTMLEAVLQGTWSPLHSTLGMTDVSVVSSDNSIISASSGFYDYEVGDVINISGFAETENNGRAVVVSATDSRITLSGITLVDEVAGETVTLELISGRLKAGVVRRSFSFLRHFTDQSSSDKPYHLFSGVELNTLSLTIPASGMVTGSFGVVGKALDVLGDLSTLTNSTGPTFTAPTTTAPFDSFTGTITEAGSSISVVTEVSLSLANGLAPRNVVGSDETILPSVGRSNLTGSVTAFFENATLLEKFLDETESSLIVNLVDPAGNAYELELPRIKYTGGQPDVSGEGSITINFPIQALYSVDDLSNIVITRVDA